MIKIDITKARKLPIPIEGVSFRQLDEDYYTNQPKKSQLNHSITNDDSVTEIPSSAKKTRHISAYTTNRYSGKLDFFQDTEKAIKTLCPL